MTNLVIGRTYYGPGEERLTVMGINGNHVDVMRPVSLRTDRRTVKQMEKFIKGSTRRTYQHKKTGELRIKLDAAKKGDVRYMTPDHQIETVTAKGWAAWRKNA